MSRKPKFNPEITRVKLNPEQAVLACSCWSNAFYVSDATSGSREGCVRDTRDYLPSISKVRGTAASS